MTPTIQQMQSDLQAFRASKQGIPAAAPVAAPAPVQAPAPTPEADPIDQDLAQYRAQKASGTVQKRTIPKEPSALANMAKSIFSAPATIVARPFQAAADFGDYLGTRIEEKAANDRGDSAGATAILNAEADRRTERETKSTFGGFVAPVPKDTKDVIKDVGRAAQTVALGTGAPLAGGALFGVGSSLEQGNDLLSTDTAFNAALGAAGGKVLGFVGKPLLNASGKVVGAITPQILKDVASKGAGAIQKFAAENRLLGGIAAKPSEMLAKGLQKVDDTIDAGARKVATGARDVVQSQYPNASPTKHYQAVNEKDILRPTTVNEPKYAKSSRVYNDAKSRGIDIEKVATDRGIIHDKIAEGGKYNTLDTVENIREGNYSVSDSIARPAIKAAEPGVRLVPLGEVRSAMLKRITDIPASQIDAADRAQLIKQISRRYAPGSAADNAHPNGFSLTDLHDARIISGKNGKFKPGADPSSALTAQRAREEGRVFADLFDKTVPDEVGMKEFRKELEKNFLLADYLEALHGKSVPAGITKKAARLFGRAAAATVGGKIGGFPGSILGAQYGDMIFSSFEALPNPIKMAVLQNVKIENPKVYKALVEYIGKEEAARLMRLALPGRGESSFKEIPPTMYTTPGGKSTTIKSEAIDVAAVEQGRAKPTKTDRRLKSYLNKVDFASQDPAYTPDKDLPIIKMGKKPKPKKNLNDIY